MHPVHDIEGKGRGWSKHMYVDLGYDTCSSYAHESFKLSV